MTDLMDLSAMALVLETYANLAMTSGELSE